MRLIERLLELQGFPPAPRELTKPMCTPGHYTERVCRPDPRTLLRQKAKKARAARLASHDQAIWKQAADQPVSRPAESRPYILTEWELGLREPVQGSAAGGTYPTFSGPQPASQIVQSQSL